ncbi:TRAP transporter substrate-binding protein [Fulvimarina sp. MAC8]|uniref:TRAP transporter substrate-binding protein n=1 Tax=Fulvimarina sp. MAC8 TaxID=3162874 RepID=UPI0032EF6F52
MLSLNTKILGAAAIAASLIAGPSLAQETHLKFAHWAAPEHTLKPTIIDPLSEGLTEATDGELVVDVYPGGELGPGPAEQYKRALTGVADMVWGLPGYTSSQFPLSMIVELPGVVEEAGSGYEAVWNVYDDYLTSEFPGTRPVALWASEPNILILGDRQVRTLDDLAGLKIRVSGSNPGRLIEALGATPVQMPATEMYTALQTGLIDGVLTGASAVGDFRLNEIADVYVEGPQLGNILFYVVLNQAKYDSLTDAQKQAIDATAGKELSRSGEEGWNAAADRVLDELRETEGKTVITLSEEESAPFDKVATEVRESIIADLTAQGLPAEEVLAAMTGQSSQ